MNQKHSFAKPSFIPIKSEIPPSPLQALFRLPKLARISASNNELEHVPWELWTAPALAELSLAHNRLRTLPAAPPDAGAEGIARCSASLSDLNTLDPTNGGECRG